MPHSSTARPRVGLLVPTARRASVLLPASLERLRSLSDVVDAGTTTQEIAQRLPDLLPELDACLTGWGSPKLAPELLGQANRLRLIAHTAGSIKAIVPVEAFDRSVVCHAAGIIAEAVAECTLLSILTGLRQHHRLDAALKAGKSWGEASEIHFGHQFAGSDVGLIGCGYVGRQVIALLRPFKLRIRVYDPYLSEERAAELGVEKASLDRVMESSQVVSNHAPITPETRHLIGQRQFSLLRDGAIFVNTARAWTIDYDALYGQLATGRFWAALDVFEEEPLPVTSPLRRLENVILTPHIAGRTVETYAKQGEAMVDEVGRYFAGEELKYRVSPESYGIMA